MSETLDISIVIPSYNRGSVVSENIAKCLALHPQAKEIILVDDHSDVESEAVLRELAKQHKSVHYVRLDKNGGQAVSRSIGMATASGKYIVSLDDDSWFIDIDGLQRVWDRMESLPQCGILAFSPFTPERPVKPAKDDLMFVADHIACGVAYRTAVFRSIGYHAHFLRAAGEESDLSIKVIANDYDVIQDFNIRIFHDYDPDSRPIASIKAFRRQAARNDLLLPVMYFPFYYAFLVVIWRVFSNFRYGVKNGYVWSAIQAIGGFIALFPAAVKHRDTISVKATQRYMRLRRCPEALKL